MRFVDYLYGCVSVCVVFACEWLLVKYKGRNAPRFRHFTGSLFCTILSLFILFIYHRTKIPLSGKNKAAESDKKNFTHLLFQIVGSRHGCSTCANSSTSSTTKPSRTSKLSLSECDLALSRPFLHILVLINTHVFLRVLTA